MVDTMLDWLIIKEGGTIRCPANTKGVPYKVIFLQDLVGIINGRVAVMIGTNRKEKKEINKNKVFSMIIVMLLTLLPLIVWIVLSSNHTIKSDIISYELDKDFLPIPGGFFENETYDRYNMSYSDAKDLQENPENYRGYFFNIDVKNVSMQTVYWVQANLSKGYKGIWMHRSGLEEWQLDIEPNHTYSGYIYIIVKTSDMAEKEIDEFIRSIGITVSARNVDWLPFVTSETIYFEK